MKEKTTPRKYREVWSSSYNADARRNAFKEKKTREVPSSSLSASVLLGWITRWSLYGHVLFYASLRYLSNNISVGCANSHLQIQNAVHHNHRARADLHARTNISGMTLRRLCIKAWIMYTWTNIDKAASYHANKQTKSTQFILHRARTWTTRYVKKRSAWISVIFTL